MKHLLLLHRTRFNTWYSHDSLQPCIPPIPGNQSSVLIWLLRAPGTQCGTHTDTLIHVIRKKINRIFLLRRQSLNVQLRLVMNS